MANKYTIDIYSIISDSHALLSLHEDTFLPIAGPDHYPTSLQKFKDSLRSGRVVVARIDDDYVGFAGYRKISDEPDLKEHIGNWIGWAKDKSNESELLQLMKEAQAKLGKGKAVAEIYENPAAQNETAVQENDIYLSEIAVKPYFRRRGIGSELIKRIIGVAKDSDCSAIYASCWGGGSVSVLCDKLGFLPILNAGPRYYDGQAEEVMVLFLEEMKEDLQRECL